MIDEGKCVFHLRDANDDNEYKSNFYFKKSCIFATNQLSLTQTHIKKSRIKLTY